MDHFNRAIITTGDGSNTIAIPELSLTYHSTRGAVQESQHVFIEAGLQEAFRQFPQGIITVFEMGFGTGLNALLTAEEAAKAGREIHYLSIEQFPIGLREAELMNYRADAAAKALFMQLHEAQWEQEVQITPFFKLHKMKGDLVTFKMPGPFRVVYYDAFAPDAQPALWTEELFRKVFEAMEVGGVLTTYCSKSIVRRAMTAARFTVKKIPGPQGKREMVQAFRLR